MEPNPAPSSLSSSGQAQTTPPGTTTSSTLESPSPGSGQVPPINPSQPIKPKGKFPLAVVVGIVVFLVTGGIVGFLYKDQLMGIGVKPAPTPVIQKVAISPSPDSYSSWKTFNHKDFSFHYPSKLNLEDNSMYKRDPNVILKDNTGFYLSINLDGQTSKPIDSTIPTLKKEKIMIGNRNIEFEHYITSVTKQKALSAYKNENKLPFNSLYIYLSFLHFESDMLMVREILSTFKFTDSQTLDTSTWKTYTMKTAKISFKYPATWTVKETPQAGNGQYKTMITGPNGEISLTWDGSEYGGGCPIETTKKQFLGQNRDVCIEEENGYSMFVIMETPDKITADIKIQDKDKKLVDTISSSFKFTN